MMKTIFTVLIALVAWSSCLAQLTLLPSDMPVIGSAYQLLQDSSTSALAITPSSSTAQNWNYTNGFPKITDTLKFNFVDKATLPGNSNFPNAGFGYDNKKDSLYIFLKNETDGLYIEGTYTYFSFAPNVALVLNPRELYIPTNFTYNSTRSQTAKSTVLTTVSGFNVKVVSRITSNFTGDAFGSLKTPAGLHPEVLRIKRLRIQTDSIYLKIGTVYTPFQNTTDSTLSYFFYEKSAHALVCEVEMETATSNKSKKGSYSRTAPLSIQNQTPELPTLRAYPNPISEVLNLDLSSVRNPQKVTLTDMSGKLILEEFVGGVQQLSIHTTGLPKGLYLYTVFNAQGQAIGLGKCCK